MTSRLCAPTWPSRRKHRVAPSLAPSLSVELLGLCATKRYAEYKAWRAAPAAAALLEAHAIDEAATARKMRLWTLAEIGRAR